MKKVLAIDFDGVLHDYRAGYTGAVPQGEPVPGGLEFIREKLAEGWKVFIFTCRAAPNTQGDGWPPESERLPPVMEWLYRHGFPVDEIYITGIKPHAHIYVDDRGMRFQGCWDEVRAALEEPVWYEYGS